METSQYIATWKFKSNAHATRGILIMNKSKPTESGNEQPMCVKRGSRLTKFPKDKIILEMLEYAVLGVVRKLQGLGALTHTSTLPSSCEFGWFNILRQNTSKFTRATFQNHRHASQHYPQACSASGTRRAWSWPLSSRHRRAERKQERAHASTHCDPGRRGQAWLESFGAIRSCRCCGMSAKCKQYHLKLRDWKMRRHNCSSDL